jgi:hypothetical protein
LKSNKSSTCCLAALIVELLHLCGLRRWLRWCCLQAQLLGGLAGFKDLASLGAKLELRDGDGDAVPFPMTSEPLLPARYRYNWKGRCMRARFHSRGETKRKVEIFLVGVRVYNNELRGNP